jgi:hypothetical protein
VRSSRRTKSRNTRGWFSFFRNSRTIPRSISRASGRLFLLTAFLDVRSARCLLFKHRTVGKENKIRVSRERKGELAPTNRGTTGAIHLDPADFFTL